MIDNEQIVVFTKEELAQLDKVDEVVDRAVTTANPDLAWHYIGGLRRGGELAARGMAKTLYEMHRRWDVFPSDDAFIDAAIQGTGLSVQTVEKAIDYWANVLLPHPELMHLPVGAYHLIAPAARHGDLDDEDWEALGNAASIADVREIVQSKRGKRTSAEHALVIDLERDGTLKYRRGSGGWVRYGYLNMSLDDVDSIAAIDRSCRGMGIGQEKVATARREAQRR